jgi:Fe-S-cluster containining protein
LKTTYPLAAIEQAAGKEEENRAFMAFLRKQSSATTDALVFRLNEEIAPQIDCLQCGNCCRSLMVNITAEEVVRLADHLQLPVAQVQEEYIETSQQGDTMIINSIPCRFLSGNCCTIYSQRFRECREFPAFHQPGFTGRLFATFMHYDRCPIIYHVMEQLKRQTGFLQETAED